MRRAIRKGANLHALEFHNWKSYPYDGGAYTTLLDDVFRNTGTIYAT